MGRRLRDICIDCAKPSALAPFWARALGYTIRPYSQEDLDWLASHGMSPEDDPSVALDPPGEGPRVWLNQVPEPKVGKNRVHIDINLERAEEIEELVALGATVIHPAGSIPDCRWAVMADPEGNEFCAFPPA